MCAHLTSDSCAWKKQSKSKIMSLIYFLSSIKVSYQTCVCQSNKSIVWELKQELNSGSLCATGKIKFIDITKGWKREESKNINSH